MTSRVYNGWQRRSLILRRLLRPDTLHCAGDCSKRCPGLRDGRECSGNGVCTAEGECVCRGGFRGADCSIECPGGSNFVCSGHGVCSATAKCTCEWGYAGDRCEHKCPHVHGRPCGCASANALGLLLMRSRFASALVMMCVNPAFRQLGVPKTDSAMSFCRRLSGPMPTRWVVSLQL